MFYSMLAIESQLRVIMLRIKMNQILPALVILEVLK